ncbi:MAG: glycosyltransferase [Halioglobus sp.]|nr:glycosyltransferase [Halioglobus sp.]
MDRPSLAGSWRVVVLVTDDTLEHLPATLASVRDQSLGSAISLLANSSGAVMAALAAHELPVDHGLPGETSAAALWSAVAGSYTFAGEPVAFIRAGCIVPQHWDARLVAAGQRNPGAAIVAPLSVRDSFTSLFNRVDHTPGLNVDELDQWLNDYSDGQSYPLPGLPSGCLLLQGSYWSEQRTYCHDDRQLLADLAGNCLEVVADTQLYVDDAALAAVPVPTELPRATRDAYLARAPIAAIRHAITQLSARGEAPPVLRDCKPVQLHVGHSWGGGLGRWMRDFVTNDAHHNHLVLRSIGDLTGFGQTIILYRGPDMDVPLRTWTLTNPVLSVRAHCPEYSALVATIVEEYGVESLVVSSVIGHTLDILDTGLPTTVVLHDFFPFCPALYATFDSPCTSCSPGRLASCGRENPQHAFFKFEDDAHWLNVRRIFLQRLSGAHIALVAPSVSVAERYRTLAPALGATPIAVVHHGLDGELIAQLAPRAGDLEGEDPLRLVVLGRLTPEKGSEMLEAIISELAGMAEVHLLGTGDGGARFEGRDGVFVTRGYAPEELGAVLHAVKPHLALLLSIVPETFSYTLSELHAAAVPVLATQVGAFVERIDEGRTGWLVQPESAAVLQRVRELGGDRAALGVVRQTLSGMSPTDARSMCDQYAALAPATHEVPLRRYRLPRRSHASPYHGAATAQDEALVVGRQVSYRRVLEAFLRYSAGKAEVSEKLPQWLRPACAGPLRFLADRLLR